MKTRIDEVVEFIRSRGEATGHEVREHFGWKRYDCILSRAHAYGYLIVVRKERTSPNHYHYVYAVAPPRQPTILKNSPQQRS